MNNHRSVKCARRKLPMLVVVHTIPCNGSDAGLFTLAAALKLQVEYELRTTKKRVERERIAGVRNR